MVVHWRPRFAVIESGNIRTVFDDDLHSVPNCNFTLTDKIDQVAPQITNKDGEYSTRFAIDSEVRFIIHNTYLNKCVGYWQFGDILEVDDTTTTFDRSGYEHNGTIVGTPVREAGKFDNGMTFSASSNVFVGNVTKLNPGAAITVSLWVKTSSTGSILLKDGNYSMRINANGKAQFSVWVGGVQKNSPESDIAINDNQFHKLEGTYDGTTIRLYHDSVQQGTGTAQTGLISATVNVLNIGNNIACILDDVRIYEEALSQGKLVELYSESHPRAEYALGGYIVKRTIKPQSRDAFKNSYLTIECHGWAARLTDRILQGFLIKEGQTLDQIIRNMVDTMYPPTIIGGLPEFNTSGIQPSTTIPGQMTFHLRPVLDAIKTLASLEKNGQLDFRLSADKKFHLFLRNSNNTGIKFDETKKEIFDLTSGEDGTKLTDRIIVSVAINDDVDQSQTNISANRTTNTAMYAFDFTPVQTNVFAVLLPVQKVGNPTENLVVKIVEDDGAGNPSNNVLKIRMQETSIDKLSVPTTAPLTTNDFLRVELPPERRTVAKDVKLWFLFKQVGDATNHYKIFGQASGTDKKSTDGGATWTNETFSFAFQSIYQRPVTAIAEKENVSARQREMVMHEPAVKTQTGAHAFGQNELAKLKTVANQVTIEVRPPETKWLDVGNTITIHAPSFGLTNKDMVIQEINWDFKPGKGATTYQLTCAASEEPEEIGDVIEQMIKDIRKLQIGALSSQNAGVVDVALLITERMTIDDSRTTGIWPRPGVYPPSFDPPILDFEFGDTLFLDETNFIEGLFGQALNVNSHSAQVKVNHSTAMNWDEHLISFAINLTEAPATSGLILTKGGGFPMIYVDSARKINYKRRTASSEILLTSSRALALGEWTRIHCRFSKTDGQKLYWGPGQDQVNAGTTSTGTDTNNFFLGSGLSFSGAKCKLEDVYVFGSAMSSTAFQGSDRHELSPEMILTFRFREGYSEQNLPLQVRAIPFDIGLTRIES